MLAAPFAPPGEGIDDGGADRSFGHLVVHSRSRVRLDGASLTRIWTGLHHPALKGEDCAERVALFKTRLLAAAC